jgi:hypothetical protein
MPASVHTLRSSAPIVHRPGKHTHARERERERETQMDSHHNKQTLHCVPNSIRGRVLVSFSSQAPLPPFHLSCAHALSLTHSVPLGRMRTGGVGAQAGDELVANVALDTHTLCVDLEDVRTALPHRPQYACVCMSA